jgi:hypothetical protein
VDIILGQKDVVMLEAYSVYGIELQPDMPPSAILPLVPILFNEVYKAMLACANDPVAGYVDVRPLSFLAKFFGDKTDLSHGVTTLLNACVQAANDLSAQLDEMLFSGANVSRASRDTALQIRWALLDFAIRTTFPNGLHTKVEDTAVCVIRQLLAFGFDKTVKPLKRILRGEAESPEINDTSVITWIAIIHVLSAWNSKHPSITLDGVLNKALDMSFQSDQSGPIAADLVPYLRSLRTVAIRCRWSHN